jgi:hypothetical protein
VNTKSIIDSSEIPRTSTVILSNVTTNNSNRGGSKIQTRAMPSFQQIFRKKSQVKNPENDDTPPILQAIRDLTTIFVEGAAKKLKEKGYGHRKKTAIRLPSDVTLLPTASALLLMDALNDATDSSINLCASVINMYTEQIFNPNFYVLFEPEFRIILFAPPPPEPPPIPCLCHYLMSGENIYELLRLYRPVISHILDDRKVMNLYYSAMEEAEAKKQKTNKTDAKCASPVPTDTTQDEKEQRRICGKIYRTVARLGLRGFLEVMMEMEVAFRSSQSMVSWGLSSRDVKRLNEIRDMIVSEGVVFQ